MDAINKGWLPAGGSLPPCPVPRASGWAGGCGGVEAPPAAPPASTPQSLPLTCVIGESRWRHRARRAPEDVPAVSTVAAVHQLACHSRGTCHREVTGLVTPDRWPRTRAGGSAASAVLLSKLIGKESACTCRR